MQSRARRLPGRAAQHRLLALSLLALALTGCADRIRETLQSGTDLSEGSRWAGPVVPTGADCGQQTTGLMTLGGGRFSFDPFQSVTAIAGKVERGRLEGESTRTVPGANGVTIRFVGTMNRPADGPAAIDGTVSSGRCAWTVSLHPG